MLFDVRPFIDHPQAEKRVSTDLNGACAYYNSGVGRYAKLQMLASTWPTLPAENKDGNNSMLDVLSFVC